MRHKLWLTIQLSVTLILIVLLIGHLDWVALSGLASNLQWGWLAVALLIVGAAHIANIVRWRYLLQTPAISYRRLVVDYGAGLFANNFLPTGVGGDAVRAGLLSRDVSLARAAFSVGLDRAIGLASLGALFVFGLALGLPHSLQSNLPSLNINLIVFAIGGLGCAALIYFSVRRWPALRQRVDALWLRWNNYRLTMTGSRWLVLISVAFLVSIVSNLALASAYSCVFASLNLDLPFGAAIWLLVLGSLSLLVPITLNGLGVFESVFIIVLAGYGVSTTEALGVALALRLLTICYSLLGGLLTLRWHPK